MLVQEGELGGGLWNKQDKGVIYDVIRLRLNKELSSITCHPQANKTAQLKTLDQNKSTTSCLLISLFRFWLWNQQVPRSHRHSHTHLVTPRLYMFKWCTKLQWAWDMRTEIRAETSPCFCRLLSRQGQLFFSDLDLKPRLQSIAVFRVLLSMNHKRCREVGKHPKVWGWGSPPQTHRQVSGIFQHLRGPLEKSLVTTSGSAEEIQTGKAKIKEEATLLQFALFILKACQAAKDLTSRLQLHIYGKEKRAATRPAWDNSKKKKEYRAYGVNPTEWKEKDH